LLRSLSRIQNLTGGDLDERWSITGIAENHTVAGCPGFQHYLRFVDADARRRKRWNGKK
jgi:hypothetical protein